MLSIWWYHDTNIPIHSQRPANFAALLLGSHHDLPWVLASVEKKKTSLVGWASKATIKSPTISYHFMAGFLYLMRWFLGSWEFPGISLPYPYSLYRFGFLHFRYLNFLVDQIGSKSSPSMGYFDARTGTPQIANTSFRVSPLRQHHFQ